MKSIQKLKKIGKITAGSALLVGATLTGAAGLASAANHNNDLGDYPTPFVGEDGQIQSTVVVGESAKTVDVVGAINIAGSLGQDAYSTETQTVSGSGGSWSASNGVTLDTSNDDLYFGDNVNTVRETLTQNDLDILQDTTFTDDDNTDYDITHYLNVGDEQVSFGNNVERLDKEDPELHVTLPSESDVDQNSYLVNLQANMDEINFTDSNVKGEEIELFGKEFTVSQSDNNVGDSELVLFGSSETVDVQTGESTTVTLDGEEHTIEVVSVDAGSDQASLRVDGNLRRENLNDEFTISDQTVRVDEIINVGANDDGDGIVQFAIGSEELVLEHGSTIQDGDGDDIEGTYVEFNGGDGVSNDISNGISSIDVYLGSEDDDNDALLAGESWSHSLFNDLEFRFGGLNSDASEDGEEIKVENSEDETVEASFTAGGDSGNVEFFHYDGSNNNLADSDGDSIVAVEGNAVQEDEYVVTDAGDFSHVWEVTGVDVDEADLQTNGASGDEATVDIQDVVSGTSVELDLDADGDGGNPDDNDVYEGTEIIDGQKYHVTLDTKDNSDSSTYDLKMTWGTDAGFGATGSGSTGVTTAFPSIETDSGARVAFYEPSQDDFGSIGIGTSLASFATDTEMYIDDSNNDGDATSGYQNGDDVIDVATQLIGSDLAGGDTYRAFASNIRFTDSSHEGNYSSGEAILDTSDTVLDSTSELVTSGTADLTAAESASSPTIRYFEDSDNTADFDNSGEAIYADTDGTVDATNAVRLTSAQVYSGEDTTSGNVDLKLNSLTHIGTSGVADNDAGKATVAVTSSNTQFTNNGQFIWAEFNDAANADNSWNPGEGTASGDQDVLVYDVDGSGDITTGDVLLFNEGDAQSFAISPGEQFTSSVTADATNAAGSAAIGFDDTTSTTSDAYDDGETVVVDVTGNTSAGGTDTADIAVAPSGSAGIHTYSQEFISASATMEYWDKDSDGNLGTGDAVYMDMPSTGSSLTAGEDVRLSHFSKTVSAGAVNSGDVDLDVGTDLTQTADTLDFADSNGDGSYTAGTSPSTRDVIIYSSGANQADLESGDVIVVSGNADINQFQSGTGTVEVFQDTTTNNGYDSGEDIVRLTRFGTTSGTAIDLQASGGDQAEITVNNFGPNIEYDDSEGDTTYDDDESIVDDSGSNPDTFDSADTILYGSTGTNIQYWSSDSSETSGVSGLNSILPASNPGLVVIEDEGDDDVQESYTVSATWDSTDEELEIDSPQFSDNTKRQKSSLESNSDVTAGFDQYGVYTEYDNDEQGSFTLQIPYGQSTVGAAVTGNDGGLSASGGSGSVSVNTPTGFPDSAALDSDSGIDSAKENNNMILVGGPAVNSLTQELADSGDSWTADDYTEGEGVIQLVNDAFTQGQDALVVAGYSGADTRQAANYLANYADHSSDLSGQDQVTVSTQ